MKAINNILGWIIGATISLYCLYYLYFLFNESKHPYKNLYLSVIVIATIIMIFRSKIYSFFKIYNQKAIISLEFCILFLYLWVHCVMIYPKIFSELGNLTVAVLIGIVVAQFLASIYRRKKE